MCTYISMYMYYQMYVHAHLVGTRHVKFGHKRKRTFFCVINNLHLIVGQMYIGRDGVLNTTYSTTGNKPQVATHVHI